MVFIVSSVSVLIAAPSSNLDSKENDLSMQNNQIKEEREIDDLLGPKDNFPFLPDNHRDSGTGKISRIE